MTPEERIARAGEYVLGTLSAEERMEFARELSTDRELADAVRNWEHRLGSLADGVSPLVPPPGAWAKIERAIDSGAGMVSAEVIALRRRVRTWQWTSVAAAAVAAALAVLVVTGPWLTQPPGGKYVAVVDRGGELPALIVNVDQASGVVTVRSLTAEAPADRSHELWYIGAGEKPLSLGVIDHANTGLTIRTGAIAGFNPVDAVFAITLEPRGGSPSGDPTGPIVYSGKLVPTGE
jgi:anti-sigma-K factor RskA